MQVKQQETKIHFARDAYFPLLVLFHGNIIA